ncbi:hypothetical protein [Roseospira visakhapatnamensis]|uniref:Uncharacterized protein n=1 Tax=Roseospira visakhapatnamensis TaxID=390880 RepID=A0A7W6RG49_9PROT|nr:hypothetical protein [Roseospira visakhapatnamensis]MBB4267955.1 hypothetical protein [Roseospira visakhapatnamensis]
MENPSTGCSGLAVAGAVSAPRPIAVTAKQRATNSGLVLVLVIILSPGLAPGRELLPAQVTVTRMATRTAQSPHVPATAVTALSNKRFDLAEVLSPADIALM